MRFGVVFRGLVLRWIVRHRLRAALATIAVALGVTAFIGSAAVADSIARSARSAVSTLSGGADLSLEADETGLPTSLAAELVALPGVAAAAPRTIGFVRAPEIGGTRLLVVGVDPLLEAAFGASTGESPPQLVDPLAFATGGAVLVGAGVGVPVGGTLRLQGAQGSVTFPVAGTLAGRAVGKTAGGRVLVLALPAAERILGRAGRCSRVDVRLADGADRDETVRAIEAVARPRAPANLYVGPPRLRDLAAEDVMGTVEVGMQIGAVIALLVGIFLIHHTVAVGVAERRREVGLLRSAGATRRQIRLVFVGEAMVLGLVGAGLGVGLAAALAGGVLEGFAATVSGAYFASDPPRVRLSAELVAVGLLVGAIVAMTAAWLPAARAAAQPPCDAIRRGPQAGAAGPGAQFARLVTALVLGGGGAALIVWPELLGRNSGYVALVLVLCAFLAGSPLLLERAARLLAPLLRGLFGIPGRLAADDLARHPRRAALPAAVLAFGLALVVETGGTLLSLEEETVEWMDNNIAGDLFVSSGRSVMGGAGHTPLDVDLAGPLRRVPGIERVVNVRFLRLPWRDTRVFLIGLDMENYGPLWKLPLRGGTKEDAIAALASGEGCIVSENFTLLHDVDVGDTVRLPGADAEFELRVMGRFSDYSWPRGTILMDQGHLSRLLDDRLADEFALKLAPGADPGEVSAAVEAAVGEGRELVIASAQELQAEARSVLRAIFSLAYAQVVIALAVAFLGVLNTLWIAVVLRRREVGLLRTAGATRGQVVTSILVEAAVLGLVGAVFGVLGGALIQWVSLYRVLPADTGWVYPMRFPWGQATLVAVLGVLTSVAAGWLPARAAARAPLADALMYE